MYLAPIHQALRSILLQQAEEAFSTKPDLANVLHGRRRVYPGSRGKRPAYFPSRINNATMVPESQLEAFYCLLLERDPNVAGYRCQALEIELSQGQRYFPDFLIRTWDDRWLVREIKPNRGHLTDEEQARHGLAEKLLSRCGFDFSVIDMTDLPSLIQLENLYQLYNRAIARSWSVQECNLAMEQIGQLPGPQPLQALYDRLAGAGLSPLIIDYLLFHGRLEASLDLPLQLDLQVGVPK